MSEVIARRGHIYRISMEPDVTVLGLILSSNWHNQAYGKYITAQVAGSRAHERTGGAVRLRSGDPAFGYVICRDIATVYQEELKEDLGELCLETLVEVDRTLKLVLGL